MLPNFYQSWPTGWPTGWSAGWPAGSSAGRLLCAGKIADIGWPTTRGLLKIKNQRPKYQITHPAGRIAETDDVKLRLHYNVQPWVGILTWDQQRDIGLWKALENGVSKTFALPAIKAKAEGK